MRGACAAIAISLAAVLAVDAATAADEGAAPASRRDERTGIELVFVPGGDFSMGSESGYECERPVHPVEVAGFRMGKSEVTVAQFRRFVEATGYRTDPERAGQCVGIRSDDEWSQQEGRSWRSPGFAQEDDHPVVCVSWNDAQAFAAWAGMRLPTEAEWEYAAGNGARHTAYSWGDPAPGSSPEGNLADVSLGKEHPGVTIFADYDDGAAYTARVCSHRPNDFGLCDMSGNVSEIVEDWFLIRYDCTEPGFPREYRVTRGGGWNADPLTARVTHRGQLYPAAGVDAVGFRVVAPGPDR